MARKATTSAAPATQSRRKTGASTTTPAPPLPGITPAPAAAVKPAPAAETPSALADNGAGSFPQKFDLGPTTETEPLPEHIPWGYGYDRITAMVVDPERLFLYWEVTDAAMASAREALGPGGAGAWLNVRVYDVSGRLFDGTNAHSTFDHRIERHDRQWFFHIGKPTSAACAEVGLMSDEGYFVRIARSGRVEFPRREPLGGGPIEWLSVRTATGGVGAAVQGAPSSGPAGGAPPGPGSPDPSAGWQEIAPGARADWMRFAGFPAPGDGRVFERRWQWQEQSGGEWTSEVQRTEWSGPLLRSEWEAGPFTFPVEAPTRVEVHDGGQLSVRTEDGRVHVVYGPWQVVIRGIGARAERQVLATWEYRRQVELPGGIERSLLAGGSADPGSSWLLQGGSERAWAGASELVFRGASELWFVGASELSFRGASETLWAGASELRLRGASERMFAGASEWRLGGASEQTFAGASERLYAGASERALGGASEYPIGGGSERALGGGSESPRPNAPGSPYPMPGGSR